jgi:fumarate reductase subunit C
MSRRPYVRAPERHWWLRRRRYVVYMFRELTSLFIGAYCVLLVVGLARLAEGQPAWDGFVAALRGPAAIMLQLLALVFAVFHSVTWFALTPRAMPRAIAGDALSSRRIIAGHYVLWAALSAALVLVAAR